MRMKAKLPDTIARAGESDPMCEKELKRTGFWMPVFRIYAGI